MDFEVHMRVVFWSNIHFNHKLNNITFVTQFTLLSGKYLHRRWSFISRPNEKNFFTCCLWNFSDVWNLFLTFGCRIFDILFHDQIKGVLKHTVCGISRIFWYFISQHIKREIAVEQINYPQTVSIDKQVKKRPPKQSNHFWDGFMITKLSMMMRLRERSVNGELNLFSISSWSLSICGINL